jgi:hypothetical protein
MNNWKLRNSFDSNEDSDYVEVNGHLANLSNGDFTVDIIPFGNQFSAPLRTGATDTFGPVRNQVPGICNGTFTLAGGGSNINRPATTITGEGSGAQFNYGFLADGTLSYIRATSGGSGYKVGDKLSITTTTGHGSQVIEFRLVDGSNATQFTVQANHENQTPFPFAVHRARVGQSTPKTLYVFDYRSSQVFPKPQDKLLDKYPDAAAAYGLRLLRSAYLGPAIRVRRESTGNPEKDIYFDAQGNLDTKALLDFAGGGFLRVKILYDQSGNGNDATASAAANQPTIVSGGVLSKVNGKPAIDFDGSDDSFSINHADLKNQDRFDAYLHYQTTDTVYIMFVGDGGGKYSFVPQDTGTDTALSSQYDISGTLPTLYVNGVKPGIVSGTTDRDDLHTMMVTNAASHSTGAIMVHEAAGTQGWTDLSISTYSGFRFNGKMTEMVLYNTDQSANRENIEKDMALHSGAYQVEDAPLLDAYGGAHAAYSLRKLNSDYTGAAIRVQRTTDFTEQDIAFDADGNLDLVALRAFSSGSCGVKTFYDQSGNGKHVTQSTTGLQPRIMFTNGNVPSVDERPALSFNGVNYSLPFDSTGLDIGNLSSFIVCKFQDTTGDEQALALSGTTNDKRWYAPRLLAGGDFNYTVGTSTAVGNTTATTANNLHTVIAGATQGDVEAFFNGASVGTKALSSGIDTTPANIGSRGTNAYMNGFIQEVVVYPSDQSERRLGIERNISNHYDL